MSLLLLDSFDDGGESEPVYEDAPAPLELYDPVPGNRGLRGPATLLLRLDEPDGVMPSDSAGNLADLAPTAGATAPVSVSSWTGRGRFFDGSAGLVASDLAGRNTLPQRDVTVQAILSIDLAEGDGAYHTVIARGIGNSVSQYRSHQLVIQRADAGMGPNAFVFWEWQDSTGSSREQDVGIFQLPEPGKLFLLTATRRWEASDKVVVRYYIDERLIAEHTSTDGDIGGGTTGQTTVGALRNGATWGQFFAGTIDDLAVYDYEMSPGEVRAVWRRLYEHQPAGVDMLRGLAPPGAPWFKDPGNRIGRRMKAAGQSLGSAHASIDELRELWLPDKAPRDQLARWEGIFDVSARPRDSLDLRRSRLLGITGREEGFSHPAVKLALMETLAVDQADDLEILEPTNVIRDGFESGIRDERWLRGALGTWSTVSETLRVVVPAATDITWTTQGWGAHLRTPLDTGGVGPDFLSTVVTAWTLPANSGAGLLLCDRRRNDGLWFGLYNDAGTIKVGYRMVIGYVVFPFVAFENADVNPYSLQIRKAPEGAGEFLLQWVSSAVTPDADDFEEQLVDPGMLDPDWAGYGVFGTSGSLASQLSVDFDSFVAYCPDGSRPHHWYVYRDPGLPGTPDLVGAQRIIERMKPAHTHAAVIVSRSLLAGEDPEGFVGRGPMGMLEDALE